MHRPLQRRIRRIRIHDLDEGMNHLIPFDAINRRP